MSQRQVIKQGFELVNAKYDLNAFEMKLIMNAISEIKIEDKQFFTRKVSVKDLEKELKVQLKYDRIKELCMELKKKPIFIEKSSFRGKRKFIVLDWFASLEYDEETASLEYEISQKLALYLLDLKKRITKANLEHILPMKSFYSMRLYLMLKEFQKIGSRIFEVAELQDILQVGETLKAYNQFKVNVLNKAVKEINKSDLFVSFEESKKERKKVIEITFTIKSANKKMTAEDLAYYKGRKIQIKGLLTWIKDSKIENGNYCVLVPLDDSFVWVEFSNTDKFFYALELAENQGILDIQCFLQTNFLKVCL